MHPPKPKLLPLPAPLRIGLVGYGRVAPTHVEAIRAMETKGTLVAVCDCDAEALHRAIGETGARGTRDLGDFLQDTEIDVVSICTPSGLHAEQAIAAVNAGKHVIVEKPVDVCLEKARALVHAAEAAGVGVFSIFQNRLNPTMQLLKSAVDKGRFGRLLAINSSMIWKREQDYYDSAAWRGTRTMDGGAFMNQGIHFVDAMRFIGGDIVAVESMTGTLARGIECEDTGSALFRFANSALGNIFCTTAGFQDTEGSLTVIGERGQVKIGGMALNTIEQWDFDTPDDAQDTLAANADTFTASVYGNGHKRFYADVAESLCGSGILPTPDLGTLETVLRICKLPSGL